MAKSAFLPVIEMADFPGRNIGSPSDPYPYSPVFSILRSMAGTIDMVFMAAWHEMKINFPLPATRPFF